MGKISESKVFVTGMQNLKLGALCYFSLLQRTDEMTFLIFLFYSLFFTYFVANEITIRQDRSNYFSCFSVLFTLFYCCKGNKGGQTQLLFCFSFLLLFIVANERTDAITFLVFLFYSLFVLFYCCKWN